MTDLLSPSEVAKWLGKHRETVYRWRRDNRMPAPDKVTGTHIFWTKKTLGDWHENRIRSRQERRT